MVKSRLTLCVFLILVLLSGCGKDKPTVAINYGSSQRYSTADMDSAIAVIRKEFDTWEGCTLYSISYTNDEYSEDNVDYCNELESEAGFDECIVFESDFHSPVDGGGAWNPDEDYTGWKWFLARREGGPWSLLTWGY